MKNWLWLWIVLGVLGIGIFGYMNIPKSKKRYLGYILRQAPSLLPRYYA